MKINILYNIEIMKTRLSRDSARAYTISDDRKPIPLPKHPWEARTSFLKNIRGEHRFLKDVGYSRVNQAAKDLNLRYLDKRNRRAATFHIVRGDRERINAGLRPIHEKKEPILRHTKSITTPYQRSLKLQTFSDGTPLTSVLAQLKLGAEKVGFFRDRDNPMAGLLKDVKEFTNDVAGNIKNIDSHILSMLNEMELNNPDIISHTGSIRNLIVELEVEMKGGKNASAELMKKASAFINRTMGRHTNTKGRTISHRDNYTESEAKDFERLVNLRNDADEQISRDFVNSRRERLDMELDDLKTGGGGRVDELRDIISNLLDRKNNRPDEFKELVNRGGFDDIVGFLERDLRLVAPQDREELRADLDDIKREMEGIVENTIDEILKNINELEDLVDNHPDTLIELLRSGELDLILEEEGSKISDLNIDDENVVIFIINRLNDIRLAAEELIGGGDLKINTVVQSFMMIFSEDGISPSEEDLNTLINNYDMNGVSFFEDDEKDDSERITSILENLLNTPTDNRQQLLSLLLVFTNARAGVGSFGRDETVDGVGDMSLIFNDRNLEVLAALQVALVKKYGYVADVIFPVDLFNKQITLNLDVDQIPQMMEIISNIDKNMINSATARNYITDLLDGRNITSDEFLAQASNNLN